jgi:hypothetical protein
MIVVGCGTGRCGSQSLFRLVLSQGFAKCRHEFFLSMRGATDLQKYKVSFGSKSYSRSKLLDKFNLLRENNKEKIMFDVGPYYLDIIDDIVNMNDVVAFSLKRDIDVFSESFSNYYNKVKFGNNYFRTNQYWNQIGMTPPEVMTTDIAKTLHYRFYDKLSDKGLIEINTNDLNNEGIVTPLSIIFSKDFSFKKIHIC